MEIASAVDKIITPEMRATKSGLVKALEAVRDFDLENDLIIKSRYEDIKFQLKKVIPAKNIDKIPDWRDKITNDSKDFLTNIYYSSTDVIGRLPNFALKIKKEIDSGKIKDKDILAWAKDYVSRLEEFMPIAIKFEAMKDRIGKKEVSAKDKEAQARAEAYRKIYASMPAVNKDQLTAFVDDIIKSFEPLEADIYKRLDKTYRERIKEYLAKTEPFKAIGITRDIPMYEDVFYIGKEFSRNEKVKKTSRRDHTYEDWVRFTYFQNLSLMPRWEIALEEAIKSYIASLRAELLWAIMQKFEKITLPIERYELLDIKVGYKGFEGSFKFHFKNGSSFIFETQAIIAGGYNIQIEHLRYITDFKNVILADGTKLKNPHLTSVVEHFSEDKGGDLIYEDKSERLSKSQYIIGDINSKHTVINIVPYMNKLGEPDEDKFFVSAQSKESILDRMVRRPKVSDHPISEYKDYTARMVKETGAKKQYDNGGRVYGSVRGLLKHLYKEHHDSFAIAKDLETTTPLVAEMNAERVLELWDKELDHHFKEEEEVIFPKLIASNITFEPDVEYLIETHNKFRNEIIPQVRENMNRASVIRFASALKEHILDEEKIFRSIMPDPYMEITPDMMKDGGEAGLYNQIPSIIDSLKNKYENEGVSCDMINTGSCMNFAEDLYSELTNRGIEAEIFSDAHFYDASGDLPQEELVDSNEFGNTPSNFDEIGLPSHYWVYADGKHYDSDTPSGVEDMFELPTIKNFYLRHEALTKGGKVSGRYGSGGSLTSNSIEIDQSNYFQNTEGEFEIITKDEYDAIGGEEYVSAFGSRYKNDLDVLYRASDHWGIMDSVKWALKDKDKVQHLFKSELDKGLDGYSETIYAKIPFSEMKSTGSQLIIIEPSIRRIFQDLNASGHKALIVGGAVRDALLGIQPKDIDIEVYKISYDKLRDFLEAHGSVDLVGKTFGIIKFRPTGSNWTYDFSVPRKENKIGIGHTSFEMTFDENMTIEEAALRRDFTFNALAYDPLENRIYDYFGGVDDLRAGVIRHTSDAFSEDALRVLRAMQFQARFNFEVYQDTINVMREMLAGNDFNDLSKERIYEEWVKWAGKGIAHDKIFKFMRDTGLIEKYPELKILRETPQDEIYHPEGDVETHTIMTLSEMDKIIEREQIPFGNERAILVLSILLHDIGKPATTKHEMKRGRMTITSNGHEALGGEMSKEFLSRIGFHEEVITPIANIVANHLAGVSISQIDNRKGQLKAVKKLSRRLHPATIKQLLYVMEADSKGRGTEKKEVTGASILEELSKEVNVQDKPYEYILMGRHLIEIGLKPSPLFGEILRASYEAQESGEFSDLEGAKRWLSENAPRFQMKHGGIATDREADTLVRVWISDSRHTIHPIAGVTPYIEVHPSLSVDDVKNVVKGHNPDYAYFKYKGSKYYNETKCNLSHGEEELRMNGFVFDYLTPVRYGFDIKKYTYAGDGRCYKLYIIEEKNKTRRVAYIDGRYFYLTTSVANPQPASAREPHSVRMARMEGYVPRYHLDLYNEKGELVETTGHEAHIWAYFKGEEWKNLRSGHSYDIR